MGGEGEVVEREGQFHLSKRQRERGLRGKKGKKNPLASCGKPLDLRESGGGKLLSQSVPVVRGMRNKKGKKSAYRVAATTKREDHPFSGGRRGKFMSYREGGKRGKRKLLWPLGEQRFTREAVREKIRLGFRVKG